MDLKDPRVNKKNSGNKASALALASKLVMVPKGFVITASAYERFIINAKLDNNQFNLLKLLNKKEHIKSISEYVRKSIISAKLDTELKEVIEKYISKLKGPFAVRSSSTLEDTENLSFAGLFDSYLNINKEDVEQAVIQVFASNFNLNAILYAKENKINLNKLKMPVIIQEMIRGEKFGVAFSFKQNDKNCDTTLIESVLKNPSNVTSGKEIPDLYIINRNNVEKYPSKLGIYHLFPFEFYKIAKLINELHKIAYPTDIEWGITDNKLVLLQVRYLTEKVNIPVNRNSTQFSGIPAYQGNAIGTANIWRNEEDITKKVKNNKNKILVADFIPFANVEMIKNYDGLIIEFSGITSHVAILAREYKIPCVVGLVNATKLIKKNDIVKINGDTGEILLPNKGGISIKRHYISTTFNMTKIELFKYKNDAVILYREDDHIIVSYGYLGPDYMERKFYMDRLSDIISEVKKKYNQILIDGGSRLWHESVIPLEFGRTNKDIAKAFTEGINAVTSNNIIKIKEIAILLMDKATTIMMNSENEYFKYKKTHDKKILAAALKRFYEGYSYFQIVNACMLDLQMEHILVKKSKSETKKYNKFINDIWMCTPEFLKADPAKRMMRELYTDIAYDLKVYTTPFTSYIKYLNAVKKAANTNA